MGAETGISWCDRTLNLWIGCTRVSEGCKLCYAERDNEHWHWTDRWGPQGTRRATKTLSSLIKWNAENWFECSGCGWRGPRSVTHDFCPRDGCEYDGEDLKPTRQRVFVNSLSDLFEDRPELVPLRQKFWDLVEQCINIDFLLLTKRPENIEKLIPDPWWPGHASFYPSVPRNIWWGISAENQQRFDASIPILESFARLFTVKKIWVSLEPLLGPIDIEAWLTEEDLGDEEERCWSWPINWVVVGGESGPGCRPMEIAWARALRDQCREAEVPFYMKQLGGHPDRRERLESFPPDLRVREWPH